MDQDDKNKEYIDLSGALKNSSASVKFDEYRASASYYPRTPKMIQWVIKYSGGLVKDEKQAGYVLLGFVAVAIIITFFLFYNSTTSGRSHKLTPAQQNKLLEIMPQDRPPVIHY